MSEAKAKIQIAVASIRETAKEADREDRRIKAGAVQLAQLPLSETLPDDVHKDLEGTTRELANLEAQGSQLSASDYMAQGNQHWYRKEYGEALALNSDNDKTWSNKGYALDGLKRYDEALDPDLAPAWRNRGDRDQALAYLRKALELDPTMSSLAMEEGLNPALWEDEVFKRIVENTKKATGE